MVYRLLSFFLSFFFYVLHTVSYDVHIFFYSTYVLVYYHIKDVSRVLMYVLAHLVFLPRASYFVNISNQPPQKCWKSYNFYIDEYFAVLKQIMNRFTLLFFSSSSKMFAISHEISPLRVPIYFAVSEFRRVRWLPMSLYIRCVGGKWKIIMAHISNFIFPYILTSHTN